MSARIPTTVLDRLVGQVEIDVIHTADVPRHDAALVAALMGLPDVASAVADALDELGAGDVLGTAELSPLATGMRVCGPAVTLRYVGMHGQPGVHRAAGAKVLAGDRDLYGVASAGDVAVVDCGGVQNSAVMGGLSARWAQKAGVAGCVVDGAVRDSADIVATGLPVWSRSRTPMSARYRVEAVAINDVVNVGGARVRPGDYIVGDDDGVCVVPFDLVPTVVEMCLRNQHEEQRLLDAFDQTTDLAHLVRRVRTTRVAD